MMKKLGALIKSKSSKVVTTVVAAVAMLNVMAVSAFAATDPITVDAAVTNQITEGFGAVKTAALIGLGSIAGIAIVLFAGPYVWRYAKGVFKTVAR